MVKVQPSIFLTGLIPLIAGDYFNLACLCVARRQVNQNTYPVLRKFYRSQNFSCLKQGKGHETVFSGTEKLLVKVNFFVTQDS